MLSCVLFFQLELQRQQLLCDRQQFQRDQLKAAEVRSLQSPTLQPQTPLQFPPLRPPPHRSPPGIKTSGLPATTPSVESKAITSSTTPTAAAPATADSENKTGGDSNKTELTPSTSSASGAVETEGSVAEKKDEEEVNQVMQDPPKGMLYK